MKDELLNLADKVEELYAEISNDYALPDVEAYIPRL